MANTKGFAKRVVEKAKAFAGYDPNAPRSISVLEYFRGSKSDILPAVSLRYGRVPLLSYS